MKGPVKTLRKYFGAQLAKAGIIVNGPNPWDIQIHDEALYMRVLLHGSLGFGEGFMDEQWSCEDLYGFFTRLLGAEVDQAVPNISSKVLALSQKFINQQTIFKSKRVGEEHYDLGNDLYAAMLDKRLVYTCGYWKDAKNLDEAQEHKLRLICEKLSLKPGQRVLDIGCGWGSFAKYAAENYGVSVVGITISKEQLELGKELCKGLPVDLRLLDYRELKKEFPEKFDHVVSIGMFEHVGPKNYEVYMQSVRDVLKPEGLFLLHTIGGRGSDAWFDKYIFPGGYLPAMEDIIEAVKYKYVVEDWHNFGADYNRTLLAWFENFDAAWRELKASGKYNDRFYRMWRYYLLSMAGAFGVRNLGLWQIVLSPNGVPGGYKSVR